MANIVLETLRSETRTLHRQTELALDLRRSTSSLTEYASLLERLLGFYEPLEMRLLEDPNSNVRAAAGFEARRKSPALRADLAILNPGLVEVPRCTYVPALESQLSQVGAWYVVEGATRGGRVIADHLGRQLQLHRHNGARFFDCYGEGRDRKWDEFCEFLAAVPASGSGQVTAGAVAVFSAMRRWLTEQRGPAGSGAA